MTTKKPYELWAATGNKVECVGTYSSIKQLEKAWLTTSYQSIEAKVVVDGKRVVISDRMPRRSLLGFRDAKDRDAYIEANAKYFTCVRFRGVGDYERHQCTTRKEADDLGEQLSIANKGNYMIYAVARDDQSALVNTILYNNQTRKK